MTNKIDLTKSECKNAMYTLYEAYLITEKEKITILKNIETSKILRED